jgi:hypothetical protein
MWMAATGKAARTRSVVVGCWTKVDIKLRAYAAASFAVPQVNRR